ncbi:MAG: Ig-like domain-containing protein [Deltaproteobacteria bacterium]|nr:Ig-like domain-containing protein [Deltaproteobacteria bacterium]
MRKRHLPWLLVLGASLVLAGGCGDDETALDGGTADGNFDGSSDGTVTPDHCRDGVISGDETAIDCGGSCDPCMLVVESTDPEDGTTGVYLDQVLRVVFSHELDTTAPDGALVVRNATGEEIAGRYIADRRTLVFTPARYDADSVHTVTLAGAISAGPYSLVDDYEFTFTTGDTTTSDTRPPPEAYDPLGRGTQIALGRRPEYALLFSGAAEPRVALEDPPEAAGTATQLAQNSFGALLDDKLPVVGQFDDDGWDEVAVISRSAADVLAVAILDRAPDGSLAATLPSISLALADTYDAAAGDFDLDGRDELFIAVALAGEPILYYLIDYDDGTGAYMVAESGRVTADGSANAEYVKVAAGDVDADGKAEAIIVWHVHTTGEQSVPYYVIHDDLDAGLTEVFPARVVKDNMPWQVYAHYSFIDVATGDVDGDGVDEILFGLYEPYWNNRNFWNNAQQVHVVGELRVVDNYDHAAPTAPAVVLPDGGEVSYSYFWYANAWVTGAALTRRHMSVLLPVDIDGDGLDEVLMQNQLFKFERADGPTTSGLELASGWPHELPNTVVDYRARADVADWRPIDFSDGYLTHDVQVGDVDGDLKEDIVLLRRNSSSIWIDYFDAGVTPGSYDLKRTELQQATNYFGFAGAPRLALPNVDDDSLIVEPEGHDIYLGDNVVTAVLAAAPCTEDLGQDTGGCSTTFGQGTTASWTNGVYVNASAGIVVGAEWEPSIDIPFINIKLAEPTTTSSSSRPTSTTATTTGSSPTPTRTTSGL